MNSTLRIARDRRLKGIEDAAHSFPIALLWEEHLDWGHNCFSFYAIKTIRTGEGGIAVTS
jgi:dTDP-4-amino-4,6-dideoxygalactose transaminase